MELRKNIHFVLFAVLLSLMKEGIRKRGVMPFGSRGAALLMLKKGV